MELDLIRTAIVREVESCNVFQTLFRVNSSSTKLITVLSRQAGEEYLVSVLMPMVNALLETDRNLETDPTLCEGGEEEAMANSIDLQQFASATLESILASVARAPPIIRHICWLLRTEVTKKFEDSGVVAVVGFIFLRFFSPALLAPERAGLVEFEPSAPARRRLLLAAKLLQVLGNQVCSLFLNH
jgi:hypothetical protein